MLTAAALVGGVLAGCGSSGHSASGSGSSSPQALLRDTFSSTHQVRSGVLGFTLLITPRGSSIPNLDRGVTISLGGPFQSRGAGRTPESAFTIGFAGLGRRGSFGVRTTADGAYVTLEGSSYALPAADFAKLRASLAGGSTSGSAPGLSSLGIDPESWLRDPRLVGTPTLDGVKVDHIHAAVDVPAFVRSLDTVLAREKSTLGGATREIPSAMASRLASDLRDATVDVDTGASDHTLRRLVVSAQVPVSGTTSTRLGGVTSAGLRLTFAYSELNQPQTIATPTDPQSYAALQTKIQSIGESLESSLGEGSSTTGTTSSGTVSKYSRCVNAADGDVRKLQRCAKLLDGGG